MTIAHCLLRVTVERHSFPGRSPDHRLANGLRQSGNAVQLELLDSLGDSLKPSLTTALVEEGPSSGRRQTAGFRGTLSAAELDQILPGAAEPMGPNGNQLGRCQREARSNRCLTAAERDPAISIRRRAASPTRQHVEPANSRAAIHPAADPENQRRNRCRRPSNESCLPARRGCKRLGTGRMTSELMRTTSAGVWV